jgi:Na+/H+-translocating membrane pyrophosphatase
MPAAAFRSGAVMGFMLAGFGLLNLFIAIVLFQKVRSQQQQQAYYLQLLNLL